MREFRARQIERRQAVERRGHAEIGQDEIGFEFLQRALEIPARLDAPRGKFQPGAAQLALAQLGISRHVLDDQDAQALAVRVTAQVQLIRSRRVVHAYAQPVGVRLIASQ